MRKFLSEVVRIIERGKVVSASLGRFHVRRVVVDFACKRDVGYKSCFCDFDGKPCELVVDVVDVHFVVCIGNLGVFCGNRHLMLTEVFAVCRTGKFKSHGLDAVTRYECVVCKRIVDVDVRRRVVVAIDGCDGCEARRVEYLLGNSRFDVAHGKFDGVAHHSDIDVVVLIVVYATRVKITVCKRKHQFDS